MHRRLKGIIFAGALAAAASVHSLAAAPQLFDQTTRLNQIQVIGTHNSYHAGLPPGVASVMQKQKPDAFAELDYSHPDLASQLDHGVRQVELDIYGDAQGGRFAHPFGQGLNPKGYPAFDPSGVMAKPGFKVMHLQDLDYISNCQPFTACLGILRAWSLVHPAHTPIFILVETKTQPPLAGLPMASPEPFTADALDALDAEIRSVFHAEEMITPDEVRGRFARLEDAVLHQGWPTLERARGKVVFLLDQKNVSAAYLEGHPSLRGRVLFTNADPGSDDAAFIEENDAGPEAIANLVRRGYLVRTRADADTKEARSNDTSRRDAALASGAQIVSTDYPWSEPSRWTGYAVSLPGRANVRCNPVNAPAGCQDQKIAEEKTR